MINKRIPHKSTKIIFKNLRLIEIRRLTYFNIIYEIVSDNPVKKTVEIAIETYAPNGL